MTHSRPEITVEEMSTGFHDLRAQLEKVLEKRGKRAFASRHEISGIVQEELDEFWIALREGDDDRVAEELMDVVVAALWGYISIRSGKTDW